MKLRGKITWLSLAIIGLVIASGNITFSQEEYDDMYFGPEDRKTVKFSEETIKTSLPAGQQSNDLVARSNSGSDVINPSYAPGEYGDLQENYSEKNVNPEYIARYKNNPKGSEEVAEATEGDSYYDEYYDRQVMPGELEADSDNRRYNMPSSYYGGYNASMRTRMYRNPWYDPFYGGGFAPGLSLGFGYTFGYMPGFSMSLGYGTGWGYGNPYGMYDPYFMHMSRFYDPFYSPWAYDPFYSPWGYDPFYSPYAYRSYYRTSMMYGWGGAGYPYCYGPSYTFVNVSNVNPSNNQGNEQNRLQAPTYRNRVSRGSDRVVRDNQTIENSRTASARRSSGTETQSVVNARTASDRDFSRSQNEYYNRNGSRSTSTSSVAGRTMNQSGIYSPSRTSSTIADNVSSARVRSSRRAGADYSRPTYQSARQQRANYSGNSGRSSWSNSGTYRSSRSSGSSYSPSPSRSSSSGFGSSGASFRSSSSSGRSSGISSGGGSRSSGGSSGGSRSGRGN